MPLYEYQCTACNHHFELRQKFSDEPAKICPSCGGEVQKLISSAAFSLKGGGWYSEGYSSSATNAAPACPSGGSCAGCPSAAAA
ncbi:zinc ribbon domain-containing protein [Geobacter pelophilus]|uniref:Zinc ribbon domain-containing protein n=1 Tax=Geoanaerobacter pelophilus TaxID=60036 RepID=A0AAW4KXZ8_9BACT|nr:zinc ribbon domain-containing protein [Geoanaerobacter pelophilus]MBT0662762.1 zinc ribbon domain-containing protein [Geoanaerobacter pelophilus]